MADSPAALQCAEGIVLKGAEGEQDLTLFMIDDHLVAISSARRLRIGCLEDTRRNRGRLETLPDFIALPLDEKGRPIIPTTRVTALGSLLRKPQTLGPVSWARSTGSRPP